MYGFSVFSLAFLGICAFQHDRLAVIVFVLYVLLVTGYYFYAAQERQCFSAEEKTVMFRAYLVKSKCLFIACSLTITRFLFNFFFFSIRQ